MSHRRRGVLLVELLTVILLVGVGGTLMAVGISSIIRSQKRVAEFGNEFAVINDFLQCFSSDVRRSSSISMSENADQDGGQTVILTTPTGRTTYRLSAQSVAREGLPGSLPKNWNPMIASVAIISNSPSSKGEGVRLAITWPRKDAKDPEPKRRFDLVVRCEEEFGDDFE